MEHRARRPTGLMATVLHVPGHRMPEGSEVDADLMSSASVEVTAQESMAAPPAAHLIPRARKPAAAHDRHPLAVLRMPSNRPLQLACIVLHKSADDGEVRTAERAVAQLRRKSTMAHVVSGDDDEARGPFVKTVDDARPHRAAGG